MAVSNVVMQLVQHQQGWCYISADHLPFKVISCDKLFRLSLLLPSWSFIDMLQFVLFISWVRVTFKLEFAHVKLQESVHKQMFLTYRVYKCVFSLLPDDYCVSMCVGVCVFVESTTHPSHGVLPDQQDDLKQTINKHGFITSSRLTWLRASASMANSLCC